MLASLTESWRGYQHFLCMVFITVAPTYITIPALGSPTCWNETRGGQYVDQSTGAPLLQRKTERPGAVQPEEEKV